MKKLIVCFFWILTVLANVLGQNANPYWVEAKGPDGGGGDYFILTKDSICYTYNAGGLVYRSADMGHHWNRVNIPSWGSDSSLVIGATGNFYLIFNKYKFNVGWQTSLQRSTDLGKTWTLVNTNIPSSTIMETSAGILIASTTSNIYRSTDGGLTWATVSNIGLEPGGLTSRTIIEWKPGILMDWENGGNNSKPLISTNDGTTWATFNQSILGGYEFIAPINKDTFIAGKGGVIYHSFNQGATWDSIVPASNIKISSILALPSGRILLVDKNKGDTYFSDDLGKQWGLLPTATGRRPGTLFITLPNGDILARDNFGGSSIWRSSNGGVNWVFSSVGIKLVAISQFQVVDDSTLLARTSEGLAKSEDGGSHWTYLLVDSIPIIWIKMPMVVNADTFVTQINGRLLITLNGGSKFEDITPGSATNGVGTFSINPKNKQISCVPYGKDNLISKDLGKTWIADPSPVKSNDMVFIPSGKIIAFDHSSGKCFKSDDGITWIDITPFFSTASMHLEASNNGIIGIAGYTKDNVFMIGLSSDEGGSWEVHRFNIGQDKPYSYSINSLGHIYLTYNEFFGGVQKFFCSLDKGASWFSLPRPDKSYYNEHSVTYIAPDGYLYIWNQCFCGSLPLYQTTVSTLFGSYLRGQVLKDGDAVCNTPDAQDPLRWPVKIEGEQTYYALPSELGNYEVFVPDTGFYMVSVRQPNQVWWELCDSLQTVHLDDLLEADTVNFSGKALMECPLMQVDVTTPRLRRCFDNPIYVQYCNIGTEPADSAWVDILLDPYLSLTSADLPYDSLGPNHFRFNVGSILPEGCGQFTFTAYLNCFAVIGQTHCITAHAWPDSLCGPVNGWSGANIEAEAHCLGDSLVQLFLRNTGTGISQQLEYIIIEDDIVLSTGSNSYDPGEMLELNMPAQGRTWRIESQQEPGHPFSNLAIAFTEGCDGFNSLGFIDQFNVNGIQPAWDRFCIENTSSYDPNEKKGFPRGYGAERRIRPGQELEYVIHFQNEGTDTAFTVVIRDTLSAWLDPSSVRPGASSHPYKWALNGQGHGVLTFTLDQIKLPQSSVNLVGSQGFISFRVAQQPNVPLGTQILNKADIYLDFNAPIVTNQTLHTIGVDYLSDTHEYPSTPVPHASVLVAPNPIAEHAVFRLAEGVFRQHRLTLTDALGRIVRERTISGTQYLFERNNLPAGIYAYRIDDAQGRLVGSGKVVLE